jgi:protein SCO1/2
VNRRAFGSRGVRAGNPTGVKGWARAGGCAVLTAAVVLAVASCGGSSSSASPKASARAKPAAGAKPAAATPVSFDGPTLASPAAEPPLVLRDYLGHKVDISAYQGKAVLVTFLYTHCPDVCPLIAANLHNALALLGPQAGKVKIVAVSTDPRGDTPAAVRAFVALHGMTGRMEYLIGSRRALTPVWKAWGVSASNPTASDKVSHTAAIYGISASGRVMTLYASNFKPSDIAHDVPLLASQ